MAKWRVLTIHIIIFIWLPLFNCILSNNCCHVILIVHIWLSLDRCDLSTVNFPWSVFVYQLTVFTWLSLLTFGHHWILVICQWIFVSEYLSLVYQFCQPVILVRFSFINELLLSGIYVCFYRIFDFFQFTFVILVSFVIWISLFGNC
jgi:hypothetical protein